MLKSKVVNELGGRTQDSDKNILERMQIFIRACIAWCAQIVGWVESARAVWMCAAVQP